MFKIYDGRLIFYQWDLNRKLIVKDDSIKEVHFCNRTEDCSLVCEVYKENDINIVNVPNILLQKCFCLNVYAYDGEATKHSAKFNIMPRSKPTDYVYTETEVKEWEDLLNKFSELKSYVTAELNQAVEDTLTNNYGEELEQVNKNTKDIKALEEQAEDFALKTDIPSIEGLASETYVNAAVDTVKEEWVELLNTTLAEDVAYVDLVAEEGKKFKKIHILVYTSSAGLSTSSRIAIKGGINGGLISNQDYLTITQSALNTWAQPTFIIEKGELFPIAFSSQGAYNAMTATNVLMGGVGLTNKYTYHNNGGWKVIRIQPYTTDVVFKAGVYIYAWGVYENENND